MEQPGLSIITWSGFIKQNFFHFKLFLNKNGFFIFWQLGIGLGNGINIEMPAKPDVDLQIVYLKIVEEWI